MKSNDRFLPLIGWLIITLFGGNVWFTQRAIAQFDKMQDEFYLLRQRVTVMEAKMDTNRKSHNE